MAAVDVQMTGPLFDGRAAAAMDAYVDDVEQQLAGDLQDQVRLIVHRSAAHPTGRYESRVHVERRADTLAVTDRGVVYGPWLVGVARRNQISSFKGFNQFRRARQAVEPNVERLAGRVLRPYLGLMR